MNSKTITLTIALTLGLATQAQTTTDLNSELSETDLQRWSHLDLTKDSITGMSVDKAYEQILKGKKNTKVIVAVIDSGIDIDHEDLKDVIWINKKEIASNGIDDDKNGYIDDIHGWNFLGESMYENLELTRILKKGDVTSEVYKKALADYTERYEKAMKDKQQVDFLMGIYKSIQQHLNKDNFTLDEVKSIVTSEPTLERNKMIMIQILTESESSFISQLKDYSEYVYNQLNYHLNKEYDGRKIIGDNIEDLKNTKYGNNNVAGPEKEKADHGTHVAGIIAQVRGNGIGGDGVADNVAIMAIRAVPDGDEYDKDIALAIRYAVDNGAKIINGSFGKSYSPDKKWVYKALKYAAKKDVLFIHASGNDSKNIDLAENSNFPNDSDDYKKEFTSNVLTIGALNKSYNEDVIASFSNYGVFNVDIFAPGNEIYATIPNNKYKYLQGTSMAAPNAAGVAALIRSYYPKLSAKQVKEIIMETGTPLPTKVKVGESKKNKQESIEIEAKFSSKTAKIVNAYNALLLAEKITKK